MTRWMTNPTTRVTRVRLMTEIWILKRGRTEPYVWPFASEDAADDFKLEHGLLDWRTERFDNPERKHEPVCARCNQRWPCKHVRIDRQVAAINAAASNRCHRCGKQIGWRKITFKAAGELGEDVFYHGKLGACFNEARRRAHATKDKRALLDISKAEASRQFERESRELRKRAPRTANLPGEAA